MKLKVFIMKMYSAYVLIVTLAPLNGSTELKRSGTTNLSDMSVNEAGTSHCSIFGGVNKQEESFLTDIYKKDIVAAIFEYIEILLTQTAILKKCNFQLNLNLRSIAALDDVETFQNQIQNTILSANVLNNILLYSSQESLFEMLYLAIVRGLLDSNDLLFGVSIVLDPVQMLNSYQLIVSNVQRNITAGKYQFSNVVRDSRGRYAVHGSEGYEWFWKQRKDYSTLLWYHRLVCSTVHTGDNTVPTVVTTTAHGFWGTPFFNCALARTLLMPFSVPFFGCNTQSLLAFKGVVKVDIDLGRFDINQCTSNRNIASFHRCKDSTLCIPVTGRGFRRGSYRCECLTGSYKIKYNETNFLNGIELEENYLKNLLNQSNQYIGHGCSTCANQCEICTDDITCIEPYNILMRVLPTATECLCTIASIILIAVVAGLRRYKVINASNWCLLEPIVFGAIISHLTIILQYFEPTWLICLLLPWFREFGFTLIYGSLVLKTYRIIAEFQSRKAHQVLLRDKDLFKYLCCIFAVVSAFLLAWSSIMLDYQDEHHSVVTALSKNSQFSIVICQSLWWHTIIAAVEIMCLNFGIYLCYCARQFPSDATEVRFISYVLYTEISISGVFYITRYIWGLVIPSDLLFCIYFIRCQLTTTTMTFILIIPKIWNINRATTDGKKMCTDNKDTEIEMGNLVNNSNGDVQHCRIRLLEMRSEDIKIELRRLYTQLQIYNSKSMRQDNPHLSKRHGGRRETHHRFSLQSSNKMSL